MAFRRLVTVTSVLLAFGSVGLVACSDENEEEEHEQDHDPESPSCAEIMDVCHAADEGSGPAHDCHDVAHADVEDDCAPQKDECIATCEAELD
jgi:hypothetical protein